MNKKSIITILLALVAVAGQGQVRCHVEGTLETDAWGDNFNHSYTNCLKSKSCLTSMSFCFQAVSCASSNSSRRS